MRVTFAHFHGDHRPGDTAEVPDAEAHQLIYDGLARPSAPTPARSKPTKTKPPIEAPAVPDDPTQEVTP